MTEDEALAKWCPFARGPLDASGMMIGNRKHDGSVGSCIGSECMAWRYVEAETEGYQPKAGFCGLAGSPQ